VYMLQRTKSQTETKAETKDTAVRAKPVSMWGLAWTRFKRNKVALAGLFIVGYIVFMALFAGFIAPYSPVSPIWENNQLQSGLPPSWAHPFGTDLVGRDVFSRVVYGAQAEMVVGIGCTILAVGIAIIVGIVAGYFGRYVDEVLMRITEIFLVLPFFLIILVLMEILLTKFPGGGFGGIWIIILIIGGLSWPSNARMIRGEVLSLKEFDYIQAEKCLGASSNRILFRHILPNVLYLVIVLATLSFAGAILTEAGISFLGFGDPNTITWGQILSVATESILEGEWWTLIFPGFFITILVLGFNLLGNGLRDALDPRLRE